MRGKLWKRWMVVVGALLGTGTPALALAQSPPPAGAAMVEPGQARPQVAAADDTITSAIKAKLEGNRVVRNAQVTIASTDGVVTLSGTVPSQFARDTVLEAARGTPGVVRIDDQLRFDISSPAAPAPSH